MVKEVKIDKMDELIEALGGGSGSLPTPTSEDNGKVLGVVEGEYALKDDEGVDMTGATAGQVLTAIEDAGGNMIPGWTTPDDGLPDVSAQNGGNILMVATDTSTTPWSYTPAWGKPDMRYTFSNVLASQFTELADNPGTYRYTGFYNASSKIIIPMADYITGVGIDSSNTGYIETDSTGYAQLTQDGAMKVIVVTLNFAKTVVM